MRDDYVDDTEQQKQPRELVEPKKPEDPALRSPVQRNRVVEIPAIKERINDSDVEQSGENSRDKKAPREEAEERGLPKLELNRKPAEDGQAFTARRRTMPRMDGASEETVPPEPKREMPRKQPRAIVTPEARMKQALESQGSRNIRLLVCLVLTVGALFLGFVRAQGLLDGYPQQELFGMGELGILVLCALCCYDVLSEGVDRLLTPGFGLSTLVVVELLASIGEGIFAMNAQRASLGPLMCLILTCALWGKRSRVQAAAYVMDGARKSENGGGLVREPGFFQKMPAVLRGEGSLAAFLEANDRPVGPEKALNLYGGLVLVGSLITALVYFDGSADRFFLYWAASMLVGTPLMSFSCWSRPWSILSKRMRDRGAAFYGWPGVRRLCGKISVPVSDGDLFPKGNVKMNGMKFFNGQIPDRVVAFAAAVTAAAGSSLAPIFEKQLQERGGRRFSVTRLRRYDRGGVGADIGTESVLVGSLGFMQSMGVDMPQGTRVSQAIYVAVQGTLAGVFALHYGVSRRTVDTLAILSSNRGVTPLITAGDFMVTESFLRSKFRMNTANVKLPSMATRSQLSQKEPGKNAQPALLAGKTDFSLTVTAVTGARSLNMALRANVILTILSGIMGLVIMAVLAGLSAGGIMSVSNITLFLLIWSVPMFLLSGWPSNI